MSNALYNLAAMTVASTGTDTITLGSAATINSVLYLSFAGAGVPDGALVYYSINDVGQSEAGSGTYTSSGTTLTRTPVTSTNANAAINMTAAAIVRITPITSQFREILIADRTYYIRTDGSDSNTGLANTAGGAFLTIAKGLSVAASIDCSIYQLTVSVQAGTYTPAVSLPRMIYALSTPILTGVGATTIISTTSAAAITNDGNTPWLLQSMKIQTTTTGNGVAALNGAVIRLGTGLEFGAIASIGIFADKPSTIVATGNYTVSGGGQYHVGANGYVDIANLTLTITGTPAFSGAFALGSATGYLRAFSNTFSGSATGSRYSASLNGVIFTNGGGATYFPGNAGGTTATGGQYA